MAKAKINELNGPGSFQKAIHMARFGHTDWIHWSDKDGSHAARKSPDLLKAVLLKIGTQGNWTLICSDGTPMKGFWHLGIIQLKQMRMGWM